MEIPPPLKTSWFNTCVYVNYKIFTNKFNVLFTFCSFSIKKEFGIKLCDKVPHKRHMRIKVSKFLCIQSIFSAPIIGPNLNKI
jgi:hypothetical protein